MVPVDSDGVSPAPPYSGYQPLWHAYLYRIITLYHLSFHTVPVHYRRLCRSYNPKNAVTSLVWAISISLATTTEITIVFSSSTYLDVSVRWVCSPCGVICLQHIGLSHSEICGSIRICQSPQLIAAYYVLHRLWEPRHPPYALIYFF